MFTVVINYYTKKNTQYLEIAEMLKQLNYLAEIRCASHKLEIRKGRHNHVPRSERNIVYEL